MIHIQNVQSDKFQFWKGLYIIALSALRSPLRIKHPLTKRERGLDFDLILSTITKSVLYMINSADPDESPFFAASRLGLRFFVNDPCINALATSPRNCDAEFQTRYAPESTVLTGTRCSYIQVLT